MRRTFMVASLVGAALLTAGSASAQRGGGGGGGGNSFGESYYGDMQKNPRLIEPGGERDRYIAYYGRQGWDARQAAARGYGNGYGPPSYGYPPYGYGAPTVRVRPYGYYGY